MRICLKKFVRTAASAFRGPVRRRPVRLAAILVIALGIAGCGTQAAIETGGGDTTSTAVDVVAATVTVPPTVDSIEQDVSRMRELPLRQPIDVKYLTRDQLREEAATEVDKSMPPEKIAAEEKLLKVLGLLEPDVDLMQITREMIGEGIVGYYDDETKELAVVSDSPEVDAVNAETLSHEITHALQDQSFDLLKVVPTEGTGNSDEDMARTSLCEGDATISMNEYMDALQRSDVTPSLDDLTSHSVTMPDFPTYLEDQLEFPYTYGEKFVTYLKDGGGWDGVDAAYAKPPVSSEQIMHPGKYVTGEQPVPVSIPVLESVIGTGWSQVDEDVVGEFDVKELLSLTLPLHRATEGAEGWGGGRYRLYQRGDGTILFVMLMAWDTDSDSDEFFAAMKDSLQARYDLSFGAGQGQALLDTPDGTWSVMQKGRSVLVVMAPDAGLASSVAGAVPDMPVMGGQAL